METVKSKFLIIILVLFLAVTFVGCSQTNKYGDVVLKIGLLPDVDSLPFLVAQEKGFFEEEQVNVELLQFKSARDREAALQSGNIDGGVSDILAAAFMQAGGFDVAITSLTDGRYILLAAAHTPVQKVEDFKGLDIAVSQNTIIEYSAVLMLSQNNVDNEDIDLVYIPDIVARLQMLEEGKLAGACLPDPLATMAVIQGARPITDSRKEGLPPGVMVFLREVVDKYPDALRAMYRAYDKAVDALNQRGDDFRGMLTKKAGFPEQVEQIIEFPQYRKACLPEEDDVEKVLAWMEGRGLLEEDITVDELLVNIWE